VPQLIANAIRTLPVHLGAPRVYERVAGHVPPDTSLFFIHRPPGGKSVRDTCRVTVIRPNRRMRTRKVRWWGGRLIHSTYLIPHSSCLSILQEKRKHCEYKVQERIILRRYPKKRVIAVGVN
jgi:hypothetical protein